MRKFVLAIQHCHSGPVSDFVRKGWAEREVVVFPVMRSPSDRATLWYRVIKMCARRHHPLFYLCFQIVQLQLQKTNLDSSSDLPRFFLRNGTVSRSGRHPFPYSCLSSVRMLFQLLSSEERLRSFLVRDNNGLGNLWIGSLSDTDAQRRSIIKVSDPITSSSLLLYNYLSNLHHYITLLNTM